MGHTGREEKLARLRELREAVLALEGELERDLERDQHAAIDELDRYIRDVDNRLDGLGRLWDLLKHQLRMER